jgi:hypothetical protein
MPALPMSPRRSRSGTRPALADEKLRLVEKVIQGRDFTCMIETHQCGRGLARLAARPCLRQCPAAAHLHAQSRPHDPAVSGVGGAGTGRAFRCAPLALRQDRRLDPVPVSLHVGDVGHTLIVGPTGAGKSVLLALMALAVPALRRQPGLRLRFRRLDPRRRARHGRRLARSRRRAAPRAATACRRCSRSPDRRRRRTRLGRRLARRDPGREGMRSRPR